MNFVVSMLLGDANGDLSFDVLSTNTLNDSCKDTDTIEGDACLNITF